MTHWKSLFDPSDYLFAHDLNGKEATVQIERVQGGQIQGEKGRKNKKPVASFVGKKKRLALNKTNCKVIEKLYGKDVENWAGKWITVYPTTTDFGGETVDCIRVRPRVPKPGAAQQSEPEQTAADEPLPDVEEGSDS